MKKRHETKSFLGERKFQATRRRRAKILFGIIGLFSVLLACGVFVGVAYSQTPPIATVVDLPDTAYAAEIEIPFEVESSIPWDTGDGVGIYYMIPGVANEWLYIAGSYSSPITWTAPVDDRWIYFCSTVDDNLFVDEETTPEHSEGYEFQELGIEAAEDSVFICSTCTPPSGLECPPITIHDAVIFLAEEGFAMAETEPLIRYWWTHPIVGTAVDHYDAEWEVDGVVAVIPDILRGDLHGELSVPYTFGVMQRLRVRGIDASDRTGTFSAWSEPWTDDGPPGVPGLVNRTFDRR